MILRLSHKLGTKIKAGTLEARPLDDNPNADWSCHLFTADRSQYILVSNLQSLYSCVLYGKGITNGSMFIKRILSIPREFTAGSDTGAHCEPDVSEIWSALDAVVPKAKASALFYLLR
jgi:Domain of unknown function (DUF6933)